MHPMRGFDGRRAGWGLFTLFFLAACTKELPPAVYLQLNRPSFDLRYAEGDSDQAITEYHVFTDQSFLGAFNIPAIVPWITTEGGRELTIIPGVRENGIQLSPAFYPLLEPFRVNLSVNSADTLTFQPSFSYKDRTKYRWIELCNGPLSLDLDLDLDTVTRLHTVPAIGISESGAATATLTLNHPVLEVTTSTSLTQLPKDGTPIWMEMHYRGDLLLQIGLRGKSPGIAPVINYKLALYPKVNWNKIYINFTPDVQLSDLAEYQVVFRAELPDTLSEGAIYLDNIKLLHL